MSVHALILAGGRGSRLGNVDKGRLRLGNQILLDRVADRLRGAREPILVSVGPDWDGRPVPGIPLPDPDLPLGGPMAGLVAAARHLSDVGSTDLLVTVAVDTPFLPKDFVSRLVAAMADGANAVQAAWRDDSYPTNAIWRLSALGALHAPADSAALPHSPGKLLQQLDAGRVDWADTHDENPFANLNTLEDLTSLARRAQRPGT